MGADRRDRRFERLHGGGADVWAVGSSGLASYLYEVWAFGADDVWVTTNGINATSHWDGSVFWHTTPLVLMFLI